MSFDTDLRDRMRDATRDLPELPDTLAVVKQRGAGRRMATRVGGVGGLVLALVAAAIAMSVNSGNPGVIVERPSPTEDSDLEPEPEPELETVSLEELGSPVTVSGPDGVTYGGRGTQPWTVSEDPAQAAVALSDGAVLLQRETGEAIRRLTPEGDDEILVPARDHLSLRSVGTDTSGAELALVTWRTGEARAEGWIEQLGAVDPATGSIQPLGETGGVESGLDNVDLRDGELLETGCHMQCSLWSRSLENSPEDRELLVVPDWITAGAWFRVDPAVGDEPVAYLTYETDPRDGTVLARGASIAGLEVLLPIGPAWPAIITVSPEQDALLVAAGDPASDATTYLIDNLDAATPRVRELSEPGVARFAPRPEPADSTEESTAVEHDEEVSSEQPVSPYSTLPPYSGLWDRCMRTVGSGHGDVTGDGETDRIGHGLLVGHDEMSLWICASSGEYDEIPGAGQATFFDLVDINEDGILEIFYGDTAATSLGASVAIWHEGRLAPVTDEQGNEFIMREGVTPYDEDRFEHFEFGCEGAEETRYLATAHGVPSGDGQLTVTVTRYAIVGTRAVVQFETEDTQPAPADGATMGVVEGC